MEIMIGMLKDTGIVIHDLLTYSDTPYEGLNRFIEFSSLAMMIISVAAILIFIAVNPKLRRHERFEDRLMFWESIIVLLLLFNKIFLEIIYYGDPSWAVPLSYFVSGTAEILYLTAIFQWLIFVDYSLYRSVDHLRRRYRHAVIPIIVMLAAELIMSILLYKYGMDSLSQIIITDILYCIKLAVEIGYIIITFRLVKDYDRESRQPKFLSLSAFIVPFILGALFRSFDESMMTLGIILTYRAVIKRDRYLDHETGFFNRDYLGYLSKYRDKKEYTGGNGILIDAKGHGQDMATLLEELKPFDSSIFALGEDRFLLLSESLRGSAVNMAVNTITDAAEKEKEPYTPGIKTIERGSKESAEAFAERLLKSA